MLYNVVRNDAESGSLVPHESRSVQSRGGRDGGGRGVNGGESLRPANPGGPAKPTVPGASEARTVEVVVARYREDVSWTAGLVWPVTVYDKSGEELPGAVPLPNVGREAHTYLTHILRRYPDFPDQTVFLQGDPFFHLTADGEAGTAELRELLCERLERNAPFGGLAWFRLRCDGLGRPHHMADPSHRGKWKGWGKDIPVAEVFTALFRRPAPNEFIARAATGIFHVSRDRLLTRPRPFYERALALVLADPEDERNTGHAFERLWHLLFNGNTAWND